MEFNCFFCDSRLFSLYELQKHVSSCHFNGIPSRIVCRQNNCCRTYNSLNSIYKHIHLKHTTQNVSSKEPSDDVDRLHVEDDNFQSNTTIVDDASKLVTLEHNAIGEVSCASNLIPIRKSSFSESKAAELQFISFLNSKPHFTRKDINGIITHVRKLTKPDMFADLSTEFSRIKYFKTLNVYVEPISYKLSNSPDEKCGTLEYIPITETIDKVFSKSVYMNAALEYMNTQDDSRILSDYKDAKQYVNNCSNGKQFPFVIYFDDFETCNPLGSRRGINKLGAIYMSFKCFHPVHNSKLANIFLVALFKSKDRDRFGNRAVLQPLIEDITKLTTDGMIINGKSCKFYFAGLLGDNLGINSILGFTESFSARYYCRFCKASKEECQLMISEDSSLLRNKNNYDFDVTEANLSSTGIKECCALNDIPFFHCTSNYFVDCMHDVDEGISNYVLVKSLQYYINNNVFTASMLNDRIQNFPFSSISKSNKPPIILEKKIFSNDLSLSASEMHLLVLYLPLIIGDLVPSNCNVWRLLLALHNILLICSSKSLTKETSTLLQTLIAEHHELYMLLFKEKLKPKFHMLVHYPKLLLESGPFCHNWSYRFESKHKQLKEYANNCRSRVNISKSIAKRHQLIISHNILEGLQENTDYITGTSCVDSFMLKGILYKKGNIVLLDYKDDLPVFGEIISLDVINNEIKAVLANQMDTIGYIDHLHAYHIRIISVTGQYFSFMNYMLPLCKVTLSGKMMVMRNPFEL